MGNLCLNSIKKILSLQVSLLKKVLATSSSLGRKPGFKKSAEICGWMVGNANRVKGSQSC